MPSLATKELEAAIAGAKIAAISIDTAIFDRYQCNLDYPTLRKLDQFQASHIAVLISEVVANEVKAHIVRDAAKSQRDLRSALGTHAKRWRLAPEQAAPAASYLLDQPPDQFSEKMFSDYARAIGADIVPAARSAEVAEQVVQRYFSADPPFEPSEKKKHEFPDAFALLSLEEAAAESGRFILCVSSDSGWQKFADASEHLICVDDLDAVLALFNNAGRAVAMRVMDLLSLNDAPTILAPIESAFDYRLDENDFDIAADAPTDYDAEPVSAVLQEVNWSKATIPDVIAEDADTVTFTTRVDALIEFTASFDYYVRDGRDRDYVTIGTEEEQTTRWMTFDLALTVSRDMEQAPEVFEATVARRGLTALFGRIEPFRHEDPTHEKY